MATEVVMPKLGATMEEGTIVSWLAQIGELVEEGDPIAEIQTDKIVIEVEAEKTGVLLKTFYGENAVVKVHEVIAYLGEEGENIDFPDKQPANAAPVIDGEVKQSLITEKSPEEQTLIGNKIRRTPAARILAEDHQINLSDITGTGPQGRIQKNDVKKYLKNNSNKITPLAKKIANDQDFDLSKIT